MSLVALLTDFGVVDPYVGILKGVLATLAPGVAVIDISHGVPPQEVRVGALFLDASWRWFPPGTIYVCVVDPGVGTSRRPVVVRCRDRLFVGPDNGLFGLLPDPETRAITAEWGFAERSSTFHGRDLFAPVAARLAGGARFEDVGPLVPDPCPLALPAPDGNKGEVLYLDAFGNAVTNLPGRAAGRLSFGTSSARVVRTYGEGPEGDPIALTGSTGRLEIALRNGNAAERWRIRPGDQVVWEGS